MTCNATCKAALYNFQTQYWPTVQHDIRFQRPEHIYPGPFGPEGNVFCAVCVRLYVTYGVGMFVSQDPVAIGNFINTQTGWCLGPALVILLTSQLTIFNGSCSYTTAIDLGKVIYYWYIWSLYLFSKILWHLEILWLHTPDWCLNPAYKVYRSTTLTSSLFHGSWWFGTTIDLSWSKNPVIYGVAVFIS